MYIDVILQFRPTRSCEQLGILSLQPDMDSHLHLHKTLYGCSISAHEKYACKQSLHLLCGSRRNCSLLIPNVPCRLSLCDNHRYFHMRQSMFRRHKSYVHPLVVWVSNLAMSCSSKFLLYAFYSELQSSSQSQIRCVNSMLGHSCIDLSSQKPNHTDPE